MGRNRAAAGVCCAAHPGGCAGFAGGAGRVGSVGWLDLKYFFGSFVYLFSIIYFLTAKR